MPFLVVAAFLLFVFPSRTGELFAWPIKPPLPLIPGHEGVGIVEALGPNAGEEIGVGDRVDTGDLLVALEPVED